eukprot:m.129835 g.129835  ORF g.129835 m.129835 type:complete len:646 (-) comp29435_c0_seq1:68-2005(-)
MSRLFSFHLICLWLALGDALVCERLGDGFLPAIVPYPKSLELVPYSLTCGKESAVAFDNNHFADGNGPRGATNGSDCCAQCGATDGCKYWSFNVDPTISSKTCRWGTLSHCCFFHTDDTNSTSLGPNQPSTHQFGAKGAWTSGEIVPTSTGAHSATMESTAAPTKQEFQFSDSTIIGTVETTLSPLVNLLSDDLFSISGVRFNTTNTAGDVRFVYKTNADTDIKNQDEWYSLIVDGNGVVVTCYNYTGCAWAVSTILQAVCVSGVPQQQVALPAMNVSDSPDVPYRGLLLDTARSLVTLQDLLEAAELARFYKIRYLHLHLTDDHSWTFPSTTFPSLGSVNIGFRGVMPTVYSVQDLQTLVDYAARRGVAVVPELEGPGHSAAMRRSDPQFQGEGGLLPGEGGVINVTDEATYTGMTSLIVELAGIFQSSPYIHVGCDETGTPSSLPGFGPFAKKHNITDGADLFAYYVKYMADAVRSVGKQAIIWGPASLTRLEPGDAVIMAWQENAGDAVEAIKRGLTAINCPNSGGNLTAEYERSLFDFGNPATAPNAASALINATDSVIGVQVNMWEIGWGYSQEPRQDASFPNSYIEQEIARTAGGGWWGRSARNTSTSNANASAFTDAFLRVDRVRQRLRPSTATFVNL